MLAAENVTQRFLNKAEFWKLHENTPNERQCTVLNMLFHGFDGKLKSSK